MPGCDERSPGRRRRWPKSRVSLRPWRPGHPDQRHAAQIRELLAGRPARRPRGREIRHQRTRVRQRRCRGRKNGVPAPPCATGPQPALPGRAYAARTALHGQPGRGTGQQPPGEARAAADAFVRHRRDGPEGVGVVEGRGASAQPGQDSHSLPAAARAARLRLVGTGHRPPLLPAGIGRASRGW